jgi:hypothetical protein
MIKSNKDSSNIDQKPPFFKSWAQIYAVVLLVFVFLVALFHLFTLRFA